MTTQSPSPPLPSPPTRYSIEVDGLDHEVVVLGPTDQGWQVRVGDTIYQLRLPVEPGTDSTRSRLALLHDEDGTLRPIRFSTSCDAAGAPVGLTFWQGQQGASTHEVRVAGLRRADDPPRGGRRAATSSGPTSSAPGQVKAPMNGQVFKVLHSPGDAVCAGDVILVLEAMKMENEVSTPVSGILKTICVPAGSTVRPGTLLFEVEPAQATAEAP